MNAPIAAIPTSNLDADELLLAPSLERRRLQCYLSLIIADVAAIVLGHWGVGYLYLGAVANEIVTAQTAIALPIFLTIALYNNAYSTRSLQNAWYGIGRAEIALFITSGIIVLVAFLAKLSAEFSRVVLAGGAVAAMFALLWARLQMRSFVAWRCGAIVVNELVIDDGGPEVDLPHAIRVNAQELHIAPDLDKPHSLDRLGLVLRNIDRVVVSCPPERRQAWSTILKGANIAGEVLDDQVVLLGAHGARVLGNHRLLLVSSGPLGMRARTTKRLFDLALAGAAVIVLSPLLLAVALAIRLEDGGPAIFVQRRMGLGNRFFGMYKFRSMSQAQSDPDSMVSTGRRTRGSPGSAVSSAAPASMSCRSCSMSWQAT